jgi:hypothetical protein
MQYIDIHSYQYPGSESRRVKLKTIISCFQKLDVLLISSRLLLKLKSSSLKSKKKQIALLIFKKMFFFPFNFRS